MPNQASLRGLKIYIAPGHGGEASGAVGYSGQFAPEDGVFEKDFNLDVSLILRDLLEQANVNVKMARETDKTVSLQQRVNEAENFNSDLFISVHHNANVDPNIGGASVLYPARGNRTGTRRLSEIMSSNLADSLGIRNIGAIQRQDLFVLRNTTVPTILVEVAFISNLQEEQLMLQPENQQAAAEAIYNSVLEWIQEGEGVLKYCPILPVNVPEGVLPFGRNDRGNLIQNPFIRRLQNALNNDLDINLSEDGIFGPGTATALGRYISQANTDENLTNEANEIIAGCETYNSLGLNCNKVFPIRFQNFSRFNPVFNDLVSLQRRRPNFFNCGVSPGVSTGSVLLGLGLLAAGISAIIYFQGR